MKIIIKKEKIYSRNMLNL